MRQNKKEIQVVRAVIFTRLTSFFLCKLYECITKNIRVIRIFFNFTIINEHVHIVYVTYSKLIELRFLNSD